MRRVAYIAAAAVISGAIAGYLGALDGAFVWDDVPVIATNPKMGGLAHVVDFWTHGVWYSTAVGIEDNALYRPLFLLLLDLWIFVFGRSPTALHALSIGLHAANAALVLAVLRRLLPEPAGRWPAVLGALVFALHPVHVEAVSWISAVCHPAAALFVLASFWAFLGYVRTRRAAWLWAAALLYGPAPFFQEIAIAYPAVVAAAWVLLCKPRRTDWRSGLLVLGPIAALTALYFGLRTYALGASAPTDQLAGGDLGVTLAFFAGYVKSLLWPYPQHLYLRNPPPGFLSIGVFVVAFTACAAAVWVVSRRAEGTRIFLVGLAWVVLFLLPLGVAAHRPQAVFALRGLYLPSVGLSVIVAWLFHRWRAPARLQLVTAVALLVPCAVVTVQAVDGWRDDLVVYGRMVAFDPSSPGAHEGLAREYLARDDLERALTHYREAARFATSSQDWAIYAESVGMILGRTGRLDESAAVFRQVVTQQPQRSGAWVGLGNLALMRGEVAGALGHYHRGFELDPNNYEACYNLAMAYRAAGNPAQALHYEQQAATLRKPSP